jgi:hypothetical protein
MKPTIYKQMLSVRIALDRADPLFHERWTALKRITEYLKEGSYTDYVHKKAVLEMITFYDYNIQADALLSKRLGIAKSTVRIARKRMSDEAVALLGTDVADTIMRGSQRALSKLVREIDILENIVNSIDLLPFEIVSIINQCPLSDMPFYDRCANGLKECKKELTFLNWYSTKRIKALISELDLGKLLYILDVLDDPKHPYYKTAVNVLDTNDLLATCKPEDKELFTFPPVQVNENSNGGSREQKIINR